MLGAQEWVYLPVYIICRFAQYSSSFLPSVIIGASGKEEGERANRLNCTDMIIMSHLSFNLSKNYNT
jgi:hypothetical protein